LFITVIPRIIANKTKAIADAYPYRSFSKNSKKIVILKVSVVPSASPSLKTHRVAKALKVPMMAIRERK